VSLAQRLQSAGGQIGVLKAVDMFWCVLWAFVASIGFLGTWISINSLRFAHDIARDARVLLSAAPAPRLEPERLDHLPPPVRDYLRRALGDTPRSVQSVRFRHGGRFRAKLDGPWQPIRGEQYDVANPPGFIWWGRLSPLPGVWIDARDRGVDGKGNMFVKLESSVTLFDRFGPALDQGAMLRLLSDFVLFPSVLADERFVTWKTVDERSASATLRAPGVSVTGTFEFGSDGLPRSFRADRYLDTGSGEPRLLPWSGDYEDYRWVDGLLVPHRFVGYWHVDGERVPYVDFSIDTPEYDVGEPFR
jgi:hypothetical protein